MYLKQLALIGFKSFADKTKLSFQKGVTAIVGPNGCGKSNIADAFRWVFGEQSARSMRGKEMRDVIFSGTTTRPALSLAEVTITLDEVKGNLPIDYEEVAVTRRLHRNGESEYFINRQPVRLKDVQALFLDSGMGKQAFSIFEQGKIEQIINFTPQERRSIFEEAASILRFLKSREESLHKLELVDQNLTRLMDIYREVAQQISLLEEQAAKAKAYQETQTSIEGLEKQLLITKWRETQQKIEEIAARQSEKRKKLSEIEDQLSSYLQQIEIEKRLLSEEEQRLKENRETLYQVKGKKELKLQEKRLLEERFQESLQRQMNWQKEKEELEKLLLQREKEINLLESEQKEVALSFEKRKELLKSKRERVAELEENLLHLRKEQQISYQKLLDLTKEEGKIKGEWQQNQTRLETAKEREKEIRAREEKLSQLNREGAKIIEERKVFSEEISRLFHQLKESCSHMQEQIQKMKGEVESKKQQFTAFQQELTALLARLHLLKKLKSDLEGFSFGSKCLLSASQDRKSPLYGKIEGLYTLLKAPKGEESALAASMQPYAQTLVVKTIQDREMVINYAQQHQIRDFSLLCLEGLKERLVKSSRSDFAQNDALHRHFLSDLYLASSFEEANQLWNQEDAIRVWSTDEIFIDQKGVIFCASGGQNLLFLREAELYSLEERVEQREKEQLLDKEQLQQLTQKLREQELKRDEIEKQLRREEIRLLEANFSLQRSITDHQKIIQEEEQLKKEQQLLEESIKKYQTVLNSLEEKRESFTKESFDLQELSNCHQRDLEEQNGIVKGEQAQLKEEEKRFQELAQKKQQMIHRLEIFKLKREEEEQRGAQIHRDLLIQIEEQGSMEKKKVSLGEELLFLEQVIQEALERSQKSEGLRNQKKSELDRLEKELASRSPSLKEIEEVLYQQKIAHVQLKTIQETLEKELMDRYQIDREMIGKEHFSEEKRVEEMERKLKQLRSWLEKNQQVNLTAIEECERQKERYRFLSEQKLDLENSKNELLKIIEELSQNSRVLFKETFFLIRDHFKKNFSILFNGGEADLQLVDNADPLEAGIEISAKPPGKQMRSIHLLSGGEKCLTAMALLFAIFEVKPSPFCILDEIDAPLDDTNVSRFLQLVRQFSDRCQFLIITHNKCTMGAADLLFGVSMEEKGISKILSMEFAEQETHVSIA